MVRKFRGIALVVAAFGLTAAPFFPSADEANAAAMLDTPREHEIHPWAFSGAETLEARVPADPGFSRVKVDRGSFAEFLRTLPLKPKGALVVDYRGNPLYEEGHHPNIAAVVDIDIGTRDLQQCADTVIRLNAEWHFGKGDRALTYHAASGLPLSYPRWLAGERVVISDNLASLRVVAGKRADDHAAERAWLDDVFAYANTSSLAREGSAVSFSEIAPGDFFVSTGAPYGHAVVVVDVAHDSSGKIAVLLAQGYMPAQSVELLTPGGASPWFVIEKDATEVRTPFWKPFPRSSLRRLP